MANTALAVANHFLRLSKKDKEEITPLKMQKLVYVAHGWNLAVHGEPLIKERVEAWKWGPVVESVYQEFRHYGRAPISEFACEYDVDVDKDGDYYVVRERPDLYDDESKKLVSNVWNIYKQYSGIQLANWSHEDNSPWDKAKKRENGGDDPVINDEDILEYFSQMANDNPND